MSTATTSFEFVITDPASNLKPGRSLQIRSRCMRGKNKRDGSRRAIQEKKRLEKERMKRLQEEHNEVVLSEALQSDYLMSSLSIVDLSGKGIDGEARTLLSRAFYYNVMDTGRTPLDRCVDLDCLESTSFSWLFTDSAFLHSVLSSSFANNDFRNPGWNGRLSQKTIFHVQETLSLLQIKMQDPLAYQDDTALQAILNLTLMAAVDGDWIAASAHLGGMKKIVHLRGNESFLVTRPLLHFKLDRYVTNCK